MTSEGSGPVKRSLMISCIVTGMTAVAAFAAPASGAASSSSVHRPQCDDNSPLCAEVFHSVGYAGAYTGHDEPALLFYSNAAGSGSSMTYRLTIPAEPPTQPKQDGTGGTDNFQLRPTFWLGMALCNDESSPNPGGSSVGPQVPCTPNSDSNIYNSPDPSSPRYIGRHPGTAFLELQFYPPGWAPFQSGGISCDATKWCAALVIWSLAENDNTGQVLNAACQKVVGLEYPNFAFLTRSGTSQAPANPVQATGATFTPDPSRDLFMNGGDELTVSIHDTAHGLFTGVNDLTTGESGSMTASAANDFGEVQYIPTGKACNNIPYDFHPMYSTSSPDTRVPWTAHSYNIAYSDEIGHWDYCTSVQADGTCAPTAMEGDAHANSNTVNDQEKSDREDFACFNPPPPPSVQVTGCNGENDGFDGSSYHLSWPDGDTNLHPTSVYFSSPRTGRDLDTSYQRSAFETDLPRVELSTCNRRSGVGCTLIPTTDDGQSADFY